MSSISSGVCRSLGMIVPHGFLDIAILSVSLFRPDLRGSGSISKQMCGNRS